MENQQNQNMDFSSGPENSLLPIEPKKEESGKKSKKRYWKFVLVFLAIIIAAVFIYPFLDNAFNYFWANRMISDYQKWEKEYLDSIKNDTFGGKTPQETYEKFLAVLKDGNILDAARFYYRDEDRISAYAKFDKLQKQGKFEEWVAELPKWADLREKGSVNDSRRYEFDSVQKEDYTFFDVSSNEYMTIPAGTYTGDIVFYLNKSANIWKIFEL